MSIPWNMPRLRHVFPHEAVMHFSHILPLKVRAWYVMHGIIEEALAQTPQVIFPVGPHPSVIVFVDRNPDHVWTFFQHLVSHVLQGLTRVIIGCMLATCGRINVTV